MPPTKGIPSNTCAHLANAALAVFSASSTMALGSAYVPSADNILPPLSLKGYTCLKINRIAPNKSFSSLVKCFLLKAFILSYVALGKSSRFMYASYSSTVTPAISASSSIGILSFSIKDSYTSPSFSNLSSKDLILLAPIVTFPIPSNALRFLPKSFFNLANPEMPPSPHNFVICSVAFIAEPLGNGSKVAKLSCMAMSLVDILPR